MAKRAIIVHGKPSIEKYQASLTDPSDSDWLPWAKHQMNLEGIQTSTPDMPRPFDPDYRRWEEEFDRYKPWEASITLAGLSAGAGFILRYASEYQKLRFDKIVLVAPWVDPNRKYGDFGDFEIDPELVERCAGGIAVFHSSKDGQQAKDSLEIIREKLPWANYIDIPKNGHFMYGNTMRTTEFPEFIEEVTAD